MVRQYGQSGSGIQNKTCISDNVLSILKGILVSIIITVPAFIIFSFILTYVDFPDKIISPAVVAITIISILTAGISASRNTDSKGWFNGAVTGLVYITFLYFLSSIIYKDFTINKYVLTLAIIAVLTGTIGGMLGKNMQTKSRSLHKYKRA